MLYKKIIPIAIAIVIASCSTKKNTWMSRSYHNLSAHYNTYFNGMLSFRDGERSLMKASVSDYTTVLNLFPCSGKENGGKAKSEMDAAIAKAQKMTRKHSITVKPKKKSGSNPDYERFYNQREFNRWVDDAYMLIGKSHLFNHEFNDAIMAFDYVLREFNSHPIRFEAAIWLARTRIEMGDFDNALLMLNRYDQLGAAPNRLYGEFMATFADYHIRQRQYAAAIPYMSAAASMATGKWKKIRWNYVLAQLYQLDEQHQNAKNSYTKVLRYSPDYETSLNARLNLAVITARVDGNHTASRKILNKLARQAKNREFRDRIYYTLAQSYRDEKDTVPTITNLRLSSGYNVSNKPLKREAYFELAEIYFDDEQYVPSFAYYDSTTTVIDEIDPRLKQVRFRHEGLKDLAANFSVVEMEDSLQRLAKLDSTELDQFLEAIIAQKRMEQMEAQKKAESGGGYGGLGNDPFFFNSNGQLTSPAGGNMNNQGQWYFYNPATVSLGKMEFEKRWGRRAGEDNWRRADKGVSEISAIAQSETATGTPDSTQQADAMSAGEGGAMPGEGGAPASPDGIPTKEELMANIPLTDEMMTTSNNKLAVAHFNAGIVFLDHFNDPVKAAREFRTMFERFPEHELTDQALFWTYRSYVMLNNSEGMAEMQKALRERFPDSRYTVFASDPLYAEKYLKKEERENQAYELAFAAYEGSRFNDSFTAAGQLIDSTENESLKRKSHLLRAMNYGRMGNNTGFESELKLLTADYSDTHEGKLASRWLKMLADGRVPIPGPVVTADGSAATGNQTGENTASAELYVYEPNAQQMLVLIINSEADFNRLYFNLADYNFTRFILTDYNIESKRLADSRRVITIGKFNNRSEVIDYFYSLRDNTSLFNVENIGEPLIFAGSEANIGALMSSGDVTGFTRFFSRDYLRSEGGTVISVFGAKPVDSSKEFAFKHNGNDSVYWAIIAPRGNVDEQRITSLLTGYAQTGMSNAQINIRTEKLMTGENLFVIESFQSAQEVEQFFASFASSYAWTSLPGVRNWTKTAITPGNFDILKQGKSVNDYLEFLKE